MSRLARKQRRIDIRISASRGRIVTPTGIRKKQEALSSKHAALGHPKFDSLIGLPTPMDARASLVLGWWSCLQAATVTARLQVVALEALLGIVYRVGCERKKRLLAPAAVAVQSFHKAGRASFRHNRSDTPVKTLQNAS